MAKKHPTSSRVHRDSDVPDDAFVGTIRRIIDWVQDNQREATIGGLAVVIVAAGAVWFLVQQRNLEQTAQTRFSEVRQTVASGNMQLAIRDLESFLATFGSADAADQARIILADLLILDGRAEEAVEALGKLPDRVNEPFGLAAARIKAAALERLERFDDAVQAYLRIAENARFPFQRREALADAGRVELQHGQPADAVQLFDRVLATFEDDETAGRGYYEMWLAEAEARARTGQGPTATPEIPAADTAAG